MHRGNIVKLKFIMQVKPLSKFNIFMNYPEVLKDPYKIFRK